jgi:hypothetical protein
VGTKHTLLDTPPEKVPHAFAQQVIDFCKPVDEVTTAWVGVTEITVDFNRPYEQLAAAFELVSADDEQLQRFAERFYELMPEDVQAGGCNVLAPAALADWQEKAQRVYARA